MALAIDPSTPAIATNTNPSTTTVTTGSFTPPAGALLLIRWCGNTSNTDLPGTPTITDNLGAHLTYTLLDWDSRNDSPQRAGQCATWWAVAGSAGAMTITVTSGDTVNPREAAIHVTVITGQDTTTPIGAHGKNRSSSAGSISQGYTATRDGSWGFFVDIDWDTLGPQTAGSGCTFTDGGSADIPTQITYTFMRRTTADGVNGATTTLAVTLPGTSTDLHWTWAEVLPAPGAPAAPAPQLDPLLFSLLMLAPPTAPSGITSTTWDASPAADSVGLTDLFAITQAKVQSDDTGLTDTVAITQAKVIVDDTGLTDTSTQQLFKLVTSTDDTGLTDLVAFTQAKVVTDDSGLTDTAAITQAKVVTDDTGLTDTSTVQVFKLVTQTDDAGLTDSAVFSQTHVTVDDTGLTDTAAVGQARVFIDSTGLTDTTTVAITRALAQIDDSGLTDLVVFSIRRVLVDDTGLTDVATQVGGSRTPPTLYSLDGTSSATVTDGTLTAGNMDDGYAGIIGGM